MTRRRTKQEQREYIGPQARALAKSGKFRGWYEIEQHLKLEEDCPEARHVLDNHRIREALDELCRLYRCPGVI